MHGSENVKRKKIGIGVPDLTVKLCIMLSVKTAGVILNQL
jgi:hypothetical protein